MTIKKIEPMPPDPSRPAAGRMSMVELCRAASISRPTIYKYLHSGILHPAIKEGPTQLKYDETHLQRLERIQYLRKHKKMSIPDIQEIFKVETAEKTDSTDPPSDVKKLIFDKTLELFSQKGLTGTTITDITEALNLGKGTFYQHFKSKEELFLECIEHAPEIILPAQTWEQIRQERNYFQRSRKRLSFMFEAFPTFVGIISIAKLALRTNDPSMKLKAMECFRSINNALKKDLTWAVQNKVAREVDLDFISFLTFGLGEAAGYWLMMNPDYTHRECVDKLVDFIHSGLALKGTDAAGESAAKAFTVEMEDSNTATISLQEIRFNGEPYMEGKLGDGTLRIDPKKAEAIELMEKGPVHEATAKLKSGHTVTVQIDKATTLSGESSFGHYTIPMAKVHRITSLSPRKD